MGALEMVKQIRLTMCFRCGMIGAVRIGAINFRCPRTYPRDENPPDMSFRMKLECRPSEEVIENLTKMLTRWDGEGWTVKPNHTFGACLNGGTAKPGLHTMQGASSPIVKREAGQT